MPNRVQAPSLKLNAPYAEIVALGVNERPDSVNLMKPIDLLRSVARRTGLDRSGHIWTELGMARISRLPVSARLLGCNRCVAANARRGWCTQPRMPLRGQERLSICKAPRNRRSHCGILL